MENQAQCVEALYDTFITITFRPSILSGIYKPYKQFQHTMDIIDYLAKCSDFLITPEITKQGVIHYHGMVRIRDPVFWYSKVLPYYKSNGFISVQPIKNYLAVQKYCYKEVEQSQRIFKVKKLPIIGKHKSHKRLAPSVAID